MKRSKIPAAKSKREFSRTASMTHRKNLLKAGPTRLPMRGGIRL